SGNLHITGADCATGGAFTSGIAGTGYQDVTEIAAPAFPAAGVERLYTDSTTHVLTCLLHSGAACLTGTGTVTSSGPPLNTQIAMWTTSTNATGVTQWTSN